MVDEINVTMEELISLAKRRGFIYQGSEIYGGLANCWDYGPLGVELKQNIKRQWWKDFVHSRTDVLGLDSAILMNPSVWEASGHTSNFADPLTDCRQCKARHRADHLLEKHLSPTELANMSQQQLFEKLQSVKLPCPKCGSSDYTPIRQFNLMFKTFQGVTEDSSTQIYLRPETAQGIFLNFKNIATTSRKRLPFGVAQIGKSFRNEITPGNFIFRTREFEQMELEFFCHPKEASQWYDHWKNFCLQWLKSLGIHPKNIRLRDHVQEELSHYSQATADVEYHFPFGWGELLGIANRGDFDLTQHQKHSGKDLRWRHPDTEEIFLPYVIEPALGLDRLLLALLADSFSTENVNSETRTLLKFSPSLAPIKVAVLPLSKQLAEPANKLFADISPHFHCDYDQSGSIGRRYRRQDEIGTPFCITVDFETLEDERVTIRHRDSMKQERIPLSGIQKHLEVLLQ